MNFLLDTKCDEDSNNWLISVSGEIDIFNSAEFKKTLLDLLEQKKLNIKIDCENLTYIDSTGLGSLIAVLKKTKEYGGEIYLKNVKPSLSKLFKITNLDKVFIMEGDVNE